MRVQNRKRIQIQPIKSPSPDVANRNIINDTIAPLDDIKRFNQSRSGSKSPKISRSIRFNSVLNSNPQGDNEKDRQIQALRNQNDRLYQKLKILENQISETQNYIVQNSRLNHEISLLKQQLQRQKASPLKDFQKRLHDQPIFKPDSKFRQQQPASSQILKEFNDRILRLGQQNKRLLANLQQKESKLAYLGRQNEMLKNQVYFTKKNNISRTLYGDKQKAEPNQSLASIRSLSELPNNIKSQIQQMFINYQIEVDRKYDTSKSIFDRSLNELESKITQVKILQGILQERVAKFFKQSQNNSTPQKKPRNNPDIMGTATNWKTQGNRQNSIDQQGQMPDDNEGRGIQKHAQSPIKLLSNFGDTKAKASMLQNDKLKKQNALLVQKAEFYQKQLQKAQIYLAQKEQEVYMLKERFNQISQLQLHNNFGINSSPNKQNNSEKSIPPSSIRYGSKSQGSDIQSTPQFKDPKQSFGGLSRSQIAFYKQKAERLQHELHERINIINQLHEQLQFKKSENEQMKSRVGELDNLFQSNITDLKKVIEHQKLKNKNLEQANKRLHEQLERTVKNWEDLESELNDMKPQLENSMKQASYLNEQIKRRDTIVATSLTDYVKTIRQLKQLVSDPNLEQEFKVIQQLQIDALSMKELTRQSELCLQELRMRLITNQKYILELEQQNNVLKFQFQQCRKKYEKLQKTIQQFSNNKSSLSFDRDRLTNLRIQQSSKVVVSKTLILSGSQHQQSTMTCHLKECLKGTFNGLDTMENKIKLMLRQ